MNIEEKNKRREEFECVLQQDESKVTEWLRQQHDSVLTDLIKGTWTGWQSNKGFDKPIQPTKKVQQLAKKVYKNRGVAANAIRLVLAQMYQHPRACTHEQWSIIPCRTDNGTIGVINIASGTAFDCAIQCPPEAEDLGLVEKVYSGANVNEGTVSFDGKVVQAEGAAVVNDQIIHPTMPPNWQQIALPTWRGYKGDGRSLVPEELYRNNPVRPRLVAYGLMTCYGKPGLPRRYLSDCRQTVDEKKYPWLLNNFEHNDPSWWALTPEQQEKCERLMNEWFDDAESNLLNKLSEEELQIEPHQYPNQKLTGWRREWTEEQHQENAIASNRGKHAATATEKVLKNCNAFWLCGMELQNGFWEGQSCIGLRRVDNLRKKLAVIVDHRLIPVCKSLQWMLSFPDKSRYHQMGPHQRMYDCILASAAENICKTLLHECRSVDDVITDMAQIHISDGPVFLTENQHGPDQ